MQRCVIRSRRTRCVAFAFAVLALATVAATASAAPTIAEFASGAGPQAGTAGPDGNTWFVESGANKIARVTPSGGIVEFSSGLTAAAGLEGIVAGPDGNLWFTEGARNAVGQITPAGAITEFSTGASGDHKPSGITAGPDGRLWFTETTANRIGAITTAGFVTEYSAGISGGSNPTGITSGPDGSLWFTERTGAGRIGRITTGGVVTEFPGSPAMTAGQPTGITTGPDGNLWFTESANPGAIGRMSTTGVLTEFTTGLTHDGAPTGIAAGDDGNLYFTENHAPGELGQITPAGVITEFTANLTNAPLGITPGADGNIWFTEATGNQVGRLTIAPGASTSAPSAIGPTDATLAASVTPNAQATSYSFNWGVTSAYGATTSTASAGNGTSATTVGAAISGLSPSTAYHYRVVATNAAGTTTGADRTFTTPPLPPTALTGGATAISETTATLSAGVNPNGASTTYHFDLGATSSYGASWPASDATVGSDSADHTVMTAVAGLAPGTTYHYRVVARNSTGVSYGTDQTFITDITTPGTPVLPTAPVAGPSLPPVSRPLLGRSATIATAAGSVTVKLPGTDISIPLDRASTVPVGTTINASAGTVRLTNVRDRSGKLQTATFWGGAFIVRQGRTTQTATVIALSAPICSKARLVASVSAKPPRALHLWAHDTHGRFVTRGHSAVATVRGTTWFTQESCAGTLVKVSRGVVSVRDLVRHRTVVIHAGQSYLARLR
jgi:streptogramin lyase